jgi:DNA (cytosine-5)-methyltransferase 1
MTRSCRRIPIIDIFAGPGGLSEGFHSVESSDCGVKFASVLSIEKDAAACETLRLRSFYHQFASRSVPAAYYKVVRGERPQSDLEQFPEWARANDIVWKAELGKISARELHKKIEDRLDGARDWILLGGPPCQAYSLIGRARMTGVGHAARIDQTRGIDIEKVRLDRFSKFAKDVRHTLYREYLRIVAVHQPAVFVMENVKGILSANVSKDSVSRKVFEQIRRDLTSPSNAIEQDQALSEMQEARGGRRQNYRLYSFVTEVTDRDVSDKEFLIRCEEHGIPQARHRVVLLGIREDMRGHPEVLRRSDPVHVRDVLGNMPALRSGLSKENDTAKSWLQAIRSCFPLYFRSQLAEEVVRERIFKIIIRKSIRLSRGSPFMKRPVPSVADASLRRWLTDRRLGGILQHESRSHMNSDLGRYLFASVTATHVKHSPRIPDWPKFLLPKHRNVERYRSERGGPAGMFVDRFKVQIWDRPSSTVTSHIAKDGHYFIHPDPLQCRSLTVREAARLQTFPDNYFFCGNRTEQYQQVGNAVPPFLAFQMAEVVARFLTESLSFRKRNSSNSVSLAKSL